MSDVMLERTLARDRWIVGGCLALVAALAIAIAMAMAAKRRCGRQFHGGVEHARYGYGRRDDGLRRRHWALSPKLLRHVAADYVAMMLPSAAPMILVYGRLARGPVRKARPWRQRQFSLPFTWRHGRHSPSLQHLPSCCSSELASSRK
jgi:predicted metal-binding membrane protein